MMHQYLRIKERYRDAILFFRLGDFYEMFFEDAETASRILDIALTSRNKNEDSAVPLCGVPYHSAEPYIRKLLDAGHKVAVCEQVEDPKTAKGVVQREVVRVITPGTVTSADALDARDNNFLAAVYEGRGDFGLAVTDITTGEFRFTQLADEQFLFDEISRVKPSELLVAERARRASRTASKDLPRSPSDLAGGFFFLRNGGRQTRQRTSCRGLPIGKRGSGPPRQWSVISKAMPLTRFRSCVIWNLMSPPAIWSLTKRPESISNSSATIKAIEKVHCWRSSIGR